MDPLSSDISTTRRSLRAVEIGIAAELSARERRVVEMSELRGSTGSH